MRGFCAVIFWLLVGLAVVGGAGTGPAFSEQQNRDQDRKYRKADTIAQLPGYYSRAGIREFCSSIGGTYAHSNEHDGKGNSPVALWRCDWGCGEVACHDNVRCWAIDKGGREGNIGRCWQTGGGEGPLPDRNPRVADTKASIPDSVPTLSINQPSEAGMPKHGPPLLPPRQLSN